MKTTAAVLDGKSTNWELVELDVDEPKADEVLVRFVAAGLCHSDEHSRLGDFQPRIPMIGGHEGAGIVERVGPEVHGLAPGDHVVCSFIPSCGTCRYCVTGHQNLCDLGRFLLDGCALDETYRFHRDGLDYGTMCLVGSFSQWGVLSQHSLVKVPEGLPLDKAVLVGCGVPTGFGAATNAGEVKPGDVTVVYGVGGIGINAVQGARIAGARVIVAVDPLANKRDLAVKLGATHAVAGAAEALKVVSELTTGQGADQSIVTTGVPDVETVGNAFEIIGKGGILVLVGLSAMDSVNVRVPGFVLVNWEKQIRGALFGSCNPKRDILTLLEMYQRRQVELDGLVTKTYSLDQVNEGYADLHAGKNVRGVILMNR